jgi:hypothetical protein
MSVRVQPDGSGIDIATFLAGVLTGTEIQAISLVDAVGVAVAPLTDAQLRAAPVPISGNVGVVGAVEVVNDAGNPLPVSGTVTATGPLTDAQLRAAAVPVSGPLTDGQLRATPVPVSGTVTASGPLTDAQLRATPVPVSTKVALTGSAPTFATVGVASAEAVPVNANRKGLVVVNTSDNRISLAFGAAAVLNSGITLDPGGSWTMTEHTFTTAQVRAIASAAGSNLAIQEFI